MSSVEMRIGFDTAKSLVLQHKLSLTYEISAALPPGPLRGLRYLQTCFLEIDLNFI